MEFQVRIIDENGVGCATTYTSADTKQELVDALHTIANDAESGEDTWLDGVFDDEL